jgi:hypothetical protein
VIGSKVALRAIQHSTRLFGTPAPAYRATVIASGKSKAPDNELLMAGVRERVGWDADIRIMPAWPSDPPRSLRVGQ